MIFYGTKSKHIKNDRITNVDCPDCNATVSMNYSLYEKYAHIYWIPFFPIKKLTFAECNSCKKTFEQKEFPAPIKQKIQHSIGRISSPLWMYSGIFIIAGLFLFGMYSTVQKGKDNIAYIESPKIGDVYSIDNANGFYSTMKLTEISKDSLTLLLNDMEVDKKTGIDKIDLEKNYRDKKIIAKKDLQKLFKENKIYEVVRH
ncbi:zinc-ribbon domain-containing protein [Flavobacterium sp. KACC 22761]|uniref:zinc-ribbon domain-containing protein n=1 Tax=Flavobacterium sp. KACC 22761 TaxID=3092665 RepID=UPI002A763369|nr:zinc-ribbon domain-containing protein [Flavobacterium sp. KACC 22761]WPO77536.1 zinc-ribbon domain-containing protein [Flavobacterium sp. KACC 22761]